MLLRTQFANYAATCGSSWCGVFTSVLVRYACLSVVIISIMCTDTIRCYKIDPSHFWSVSALLLTLYQIQEYVEDPFVWLPSSRILMNENVTTTTPFKRMAQAQTTSTWNSCSKLATTCSDDDNDKWDQKNIKFIMRKREWAFGFSFFFVRAIDQRQVCVWYISALKGWDMR